MENTDIVKDEVMEVIETVESNGVGTVLILAAAMTVGAVAWNKMLKPIGRKIKDKVSKARVKKETLEGYEQCEVEEIPTEK